LSDDQAFRLQPSHSNTDQSASLPVKIKAPRELPKKQFLIENDRLLDQIISQDIVNTVVNSSVDVNNSVKVNSSVVMNNSANYVEMCNKCLRLEEIETINIELEHRVTKLIAKNEHLKQTYKQLYDSIKPSRVRAKEHTDSLVNQLNQKSVEVTDLNAQLQEKVFVITALKNDLRKLKGKEITDNVAHVSNATIIAPGMYKLDLVILAPKVKNNREAHEYYLKHTMDQAAILGRDTCPDIHKPSEKLVVATPINKKKTIRFVDTVTSSSNIPKVTNKPLLSSTGVNLLLVLADQSLQTIQRMIGFRAKALCSVCNECLFDANHAMCLEDHVNSMNVRAKSASQKYKKKKEWKPTGKVFNSVGYEWKSIGRTFTLVGNVCPLTRITTTNRVSLKVPIPLEVVAPEHVVNRVYTMRPKVPKSVPNSKPKVAKSMTANRMEPGTSRGSDTSVALLLLSIASCLNFSMVFGLWLLQARDRRSLSA
ncbi:hypothetical protein Tco_1436082, partial [Tanacetum coccineum]